VAHALVIEPWRRFALYLFLFEVIGVGLELVLLGHFEMAWQWTPVVLLGLGLLLGTALAIRPARPTVHAIQVLMLTYLVASGLGIYFHLKANVEFERELRPSMGGMELIVETLTGAMPALAPGAMAQLGLLGLLATYRHPSLDNREPAGGLL
jgi:hypothetical protein